jgi:ribosome-binding protein aMBF1 (putative translation factor)
MGPDDGRLPRPTRRQLHIEGAVMESVGARIARLRKEQGLSQRSISSGGITYAYISRLERGEREPSAKALRALAAKLGTTALYLETGSERSRCPHCGRRPTS